MIFKIYYFLLVTISFRDSTLSVFRANNLHKMMNFFVGLRKYICKNRNCLSVSEFCDFCKRVYF